VSARAWGFGLAAAGIALGAASLSGQGGLRSRVESGGDGRVQFRYAARADVCGWGGNISVGRSTYFSMGNGGNDIMDRMECKRGPVVVRVTRAGGQVVGVDTEIAPSSTPEGVTDLGAVPASAAADYLLELAGRADGRPGREAILPAVLADSASVWPGLLALARNRELSRTVRSSAIGWLGRELDRIGGDEAKKASAPLVALASDPEETSPIRQQAVSVLARSERADLDALTRMANGTDSWLRQASVQALANSGDPRAREFLRVAFKDPNLPDPLRVSVIRGLGREYASGRDVELLRSGYASLTTTTAKQAVLSVLGDQGGSANLQWLLGIAADTDAAPELRAQAVEAAQRAGATSAQLGKFYDAASDRRAKESAINALFKNGDRTAVDALVRIARTETDVSVRRSLISRLGRLEDERVKALLKELIGQ
jgi:HEAT repeat protein